MKTTNPTAIPVEVIRRSGIYPIREDSKAIHLAVASIPSQALIEEIEFLSGKKVTFEQAEAPWILQKIEAAYGSHGSIAELLLKTPETPQKSEVAPSAISTTQVQILDFILAEAIRKRATDIHLERGEKGAVLRFRIDGVLFPQDPPPLNLFDNIISRVKVISGLDIGERRLPQDGKFTLVSDGNPVDIRVSLLPGIHGEAFVLRLLNQKSIPLDLKSLGYLPEDVALIQEVLKKPHGLILVSGSTGSGKSTTLHAMVRALDCTHLKVISIEDPVEIYSDRLLQIQVKPEIGFTFARGLRSILRHDPEVLLVGEIRDTETAEMAIRSAITGHLVLCTVHANDNVSALSRLINLGVDASLLAECLRLMVNQSLERTVCPECRGAGGGCVKCHFTGLFGRTAIYEMVKVDGKFSEAIRGGRVSGAYYLNYLKENGVTTLTEFLGKRRKEGVVGHNY